MKFQRKFIIKISTSVPQNNIPNLTDGYIKDIHKNTIGYYFTKTNDIEKAKYWRYKKNCENSIETIENKLDPTKNDLKKFSFDIIEVTDNQILRGIKLKILNKKNK